MSSGKVAGEVVADLITAELSELDSSASSLQSRGIAVISSSGTLVTLLFGLSALATKAQGFKLSTDTKWPLYVAAALLVLAAIAGIITNAPRRGGVIRLESLEPLLSTDQWEKSEHLAKRMIARKQLLIAQDARRTNTRLARWLLAAITLEIAGVASIAVAIVMLIANG